MTDSLLIGEGQMRIQEKYALLRQALTRHIIESVQAHQGQNLTENSMECSEEYPLDDEKEFPEPSKTLENIPLEEIACFTSVAFCVEFNKLLPVEEVPKYQAEYGSQDLTFTCPKCHTPLLFLLMDKEFTAQSYFIQEGFLQQHVKKSSAKHGLCVIRNLEQSWIDQIPTETLRKILSFYDFEVNIKHARKEFSQAMQSMANLGNTIQAFQTLMPELKESKKDPSKTPEKSTDKNLHKILADFAMMSELQKKYGAVFDKEGPKILKGLGHLEETYLRFRQKTRQY